MSEVITEFGGRYEFMSNFYPSKIVYNGLKGATVEHVFQAMKTLVPEEQATILNASSPGEAKRLGRKSTLRHDWETIKWMVMVACLREKFKVKKLAKLLMMTGDAELIEGNNWGDDIWGCLLNPKTNEWEGQNLLGKALMMIREELLEDAAAAKQEVKKSVDSPITGKKRVRSKSVVTLGKVDAE